MSLFGEVLKQLLEFSNIKMYVAAQAVGYDVSYISKWCNKDYLPGSKSSSHVNRELSRLISEDIISQNDLEEFNTCFQQQAEKKTLASVIYAMLQDAYTKSANDDKGQKKISSAKEEISQTQKQCPVQVMTHSSDIHRFFVQGLQKSPDTNGVCSQTEKTNEKTNEPLEVLCTLDFNYILKKVIAEPVFPEDRPIHLKIVIQEDHLYEDKMTLFPKLFFFLSLHSKINITLYSNKNVSHSNLILVKGQFASFYAQDNKGRILSLVKISDPEKVQQLYGKLLPMFNRSKVIFQVTDPYDLHRKGYRTDFYSRDHFQILLSRGFEYLLPRECWEPIAESARKTYNNEHAAVLVRRLQITWEEIFEHGSIDFFVLKTAVIRYIETGEVIFTDIVHRLTPLQRKKHIQNILEITKKNPKIVFYMIDDEKFPVKNKFAYMSIFNNRYKAFIKNPNRYHCDRGPFFYSIRSTAFISNMTAYFDQLRNSPVCTRYGHKELNDFYQKYSALINRMIDL